MTWKSPAVLVVDDDPAVGKVLAALLDQDGLGALHVASGAEALAALEQRPFDAVISDLRMPGMDGMALLAEIGGRWPGLPVVMLTGHGTVPLAVEAMKAGAAEFLLKPFDRQEVLYVVRKLTRAAPVRLEPPAATASEAAALVGDSPGMQEVLRMIDRAAAASATVLVRGESGTGKELVVKAIHDRSPRRDQPLIKVNCAGLPETLLESELERLVRGGGFQVAFALHPTSVEELMAIADAGQIMPPKSTWFEPKLKDGLVSHLLD